jgi:hypothetical protein
VWLARRAVDEMNIEVAKLNDGDAEGSNWNAYVVLGPDVCGAGAVGTNDDCGYQDCPMGLTYPSAAMRNRAVDGREDGDGACCSMDSVRSI